MTPRLVATDLDGTLVGKDGSVSEYTRKVLGQLEERGIPVIFVTGRPLRWTRDVFPHVGGHGLAIVSNGALVWDVAADVARMERAMSGEVAREIVQRIRSIEPQTVFGVERVDSFGLEEGYVRNRLDIEAQVASLDELLAEPTLKLLINGGDIDREAFWHDCERVVGDLAEITWSGIFRTALVEASAKNVTKASTLALVCEELGIAASEVIAFGDMPNDIPMLSWAGASYAMKDAHPSVVDCSGHIAPAHDDDGVARVLARVLDL